MTCGDRFLDHVCVGRAWLFPPKNVDSEVKKKHKMIVSLDIQISGQFIFNPKPEVRVFFLRGIPLLNYNFKVASADVVIICPEIYTSWSSMLLNPQTSSVLRNFVGFWDFSNVTINIYHTHKLIQVSIGWVIMSPCWPLAYHQLATWHCVYHQTSGRTRSIAYPINPTVQWSNIHLHPMVKMPKTNKTLR